MTRSLLRPWAVFVWIAASSVASQTLAGEAEVLLDQPEISTTVDNPVPPVVPTVYVVGRWIDPRTLVEYDKWRYDPLEPVTCSAVTSTCCGCATIVRTRRLVARSRRQSGFLWHGHRHEERRSK